jgi:hypothetical protein
MKYKATRKQLKAQYGKSIYYVHMNSANRLLGEPQAYLTRAEGWACDVWEIPGVCIITEGYAPIGEPLDFDLCRKYENKAKEILDNNWSYKRQQAAIAKLKDKFVNEAILKGEK